MIANRIARYTLPEGSPWIYAVGAGSAAVATLLQLLFRDIFLGIPFLLFFPAIIVATILGGLRAGIVALVVSLLCAWVLFLPPVYSFALGTGGFVRLFLFLIVGGTLVAAVAALRDVSRKLRDERDHVTMLGQEANHRIANSLQMVVSTLQLQIKNATPEAADELQSTLARVSAIGRLHSRLYKSGKETAVALEPFLRENSRDVELHAHRDASCTVACVDVIVPPDMAVKIGLIANELIVNAIKHSAPPAAVDLSCQRTPDGMLALSVSNPGAMPEDAASAKGGLGLKLIDALTRGLGGTIVHDGSGNRTTVTVTFPLPVLPPAAAPKDRKRDARQPLTN